MITFIVVGAIGLLLLLVSIVVGDLLDVFDVGDGLVSGVALGAALAIFGLAGVVTSQTDLAPGWTYAVAVGMALAALVLIQLVVRRVTRRESGPFLATSAERIERGVRVRVVAENGPRVEVAPLGDPAPGEPQTN